MSNPTKKMLHLVKDVPSINEMEGSTPTRKLRVRRPFQAAIHKRFRAEEMFHPIWETSNFFDMFLPEGVKYVELTVLGGDEYETAHNVAWFDRIGRDGYKINGVAFRVIYGDWDGDQGTAVLVPASEIKNLQDMGLKLIINNPADKPKVRKYNRRIRAHHEWAVQGNVIGGYTAPKGEVLSIQINDMTFDMLHVDLKSMHKYDVALADGIALIELSLCKELGELYGIDKLQNARVGDAFKGTALSMLGMGKGFFHVIDSGDNAEFGIILYGAKKQVEFNHFFLGSLGDVKGGDAYTDMQSAINFDYWKDDILLNQAKLFISQVVEAINNEHKLRHLFLTHIAPVGDVLENESEGGRETWVLIEALRKGVSLRKNPGLRRRVIRHLFTHVLDATKGRVPFLTAGARFNMMPDLNCFGTDGSVDHTRSSIPEDAVVCMDLNMGPLAMYRQPSGHKKELIVTTNIHDRRFRRFRGHNRIILGSSAYYQLAVMGGGDMDDAVNATDELAWVEAMATGDYPVTELAAAPGGLEAENKYRRTEVFPRLWSMADFFEANAKATVRGLSIGPVVNACMLDSLLSGEHKENMLSHIADAIVDAKDDMAKEDLRIRYDWLRNREDYLLREVASNLEGFIDYVKMGKGDPTVLEPLVKKIIDVRDNSMVIPMSFMIKNSKGRVRVTSKRLQDQDFIIAPSLLCDTLRLINTEVLQLQEALTEEEWLNVDAIPESLNLAFPRDKAYRDEAFELRDAWREAFTDNTVELGIRYKNAIDQVVKPSFLNPDFDDEIRTSLAVEHARLTYKSRMTEAQRNENGTFRNYPDGLLWTNTIGVYYIKALEEAGLTGLYVPVQFDRWSRNFSRSSFDVKVIAGVVIRAEDGLMLGTTMNSTDDIEDGEYPMVDGMITVREPSAELDMDSTLVSDNFDNAENLDYDLDLDEIFARG